MAKPRQPIGINRRIPRQARSEETLAAILEGAAQVLEAGGLAAFTTNAVAERAGVSIGTLYQYFADKNALMRTLAQREIETALSDVARALDGKADPSVEGRVRAMVRAIANAFHGRQRARKAVLQAVLAQGSSAEFMTPIAAFIARQSVERDERTPRLFATLEREQIFVITRAVMGAIRAAVLEEQPFLRSRRFEDELVRLSMAYLGAVTSARASTAPG